MLFASTRQLHRALPCDEGGFEGHERRLEGLDLMVGSALVARGFCDVRASRRFVLTVSRR
jgi:hypothetical protein